MKAPLKDFLKREGVTVEDFSKAIGWKERTAKTLVNGKKKPKHKQLMELAAYSKGELKPSTFYGKPPEFGDWDFIKANYYGGNKKDTNKAKRRRA